MTLARTSLFVLLFAAGSAAADAQTHESPRSLIDAIRARHATTEPLTRTFVQETINHRPDGRVDTTTWYEALMPGRLRIDIEPLDAGIGILWIDGIRYTMRGGEVADRRPDTNPLLVLLADLFAQSVDRSLEVFDSLGVDTTTISRNEWNDRAVWVVGAVPGDTTANQFWIEADRLVPVRLLLRIGPQQQAQLDARIGGYREIDGRWAETEVMIWVNGTLWQEERYSEVRLGIPLDPELFDPDRWEQESPYWR